MTEFTWLCEATGGGTPAYLDATTTNGGMKLTTDANSALRFSDPEMARIMCGVAHHREGYLLRPVEHGFVTIQQEPTAWGVTPRYEDTDGFFDFTTDKDAAATLKQRGWTITPLFTLPTDEAETLRYEIDALTEKLRCAREAAAGAEMLLRQVETIVMNTNNNPL